MPIDPPIRPDATARPGTFADEIGPWLEWVGDLALELQSQDYARRHMSNATPGGTPDDITLDTGLGLANLTPGQRIEFQTATNNTGPVTIDIDGTGPLTAKTITGEALISGFIRTDTRTVCYFDGVDIVVRREAQRGSNANGDFIRYEDRTMICTATQASRGPVDNVDGGGFRSSVYGWNYPAAFVASPQVFAGVVRNNDINPAAWATARTRTASAFNYYLQTLATTAHTAFDVDLMAYGRWY